jgi:ABC-2 type transport system permease protein
MSSKQGDTKMVTTTIPKRIPVPKKRNRGLAITVQSIIYARTPLALGCFYGVLIALILAPLYPSISQANLGAYLSSGVISGLVGGHLTNFSSFTAFLALELYSSFYGLLFGGILAWIGGSVLPLTIENGTIDLALSRPISRTRYYLESWFGALICGAIIGVAIVFAVWIDTFLVKNADINWQWLWITQLVQWAFMFFAAGLGMFFGSFMNGSRAAGGAAVGIIALAYLINTFGQITDKISWLLKIGPFYYAPAIDTLVNHQLTWWYPLVLVGAGLVLGIVGLFVFNKRDLPSV